MNLYLDNWAAAMADDCDRANHSITASALSCLPPQTDAPGQWPRLWRSWHMAAARGVKVLLILPHPTNTHPATCKNAWAADYAAKVGVQTRLLRGARLLHCKSLVVDGRVSWIGSGNFTSAAAHHNHEAYLRADDPGIAAQVLARWGLLP